MRVSIVDISNPNFYINYPSSLWKIMRQELSYLRPHSTTIIVFWDGLLTFFQVWDESPSFGESLKSNRLANVLIFPLFEKNTNPSYYNNYNYYSYSSWAHAYRSFLIYNSTEIPLIFEEKYPIFYSYWAGLKKCPEKVTDYKKTESFLVAVMWPKK